MTPHDTLHELEATFAALEKVLREEYAALTRLDGAGIDEATQKKAALDEKLRSFQGKIGDQPDIRRSLERLKSAAQMNQALLIHARTCLKGAFETLTGSPQDGNSYARPLTTRPAVRINVRG